MVWELFFGGRCGEIGFHLRSGNERGGSFADRRYEQGGSGEPVSSALRSDWRQSRGARQCWRVWHPTFETDSCGTIPAGVSIGESRSEILVHCEFCLRGWGVPVCGRRRSGVLGEAGGG